MSAVFIAVVLLAGFIYAELNTKTKYRLIKSTGWHTYFIAAKYGVYFAIAASITTLALYPSLKDQPFFVWAAIWGISTLALAAGWGKYRYLFIRACKPLTTECFKIARRVAVANPPIHKIWRTMRMWKADYEDESAQESAYLLARKNEFEYMLYRALRQVQMLQITLKSSKVYIGYIQNTLMNDNFEDTEYFTIFPLLSGYRDKDDQTLTLTTSYFEAYEQIENGAQTTENLEEQFRILVPRSEVMSMSYFRPDYYENFVGNEVDSNAHA